MKSVSPLAPPYMALLAAAMTIGAQLQFAAAQDVPKNFVVHDVPKPVAAITFEDAQARRMDLRDFNGRVVVLNIWATWCGPCRREMPALDRLQEQMGGPELAVVPVSIDRGGIETVRRFYGEIGIRNLPIYLDVSGQAIRQIGALGLPTTLILDHNGAEVSRVLGPAEWDAPEIAEFLKRIIAKTGERTQRTQADGDGAGSTPRDSITPG